jgi:hypothetical protein
MIKIIKKYLHKRKIEKKIKYINNFVHGRCSHKVFDPELDSMAEEIINYVKNSGKYSYVEYTTIANGLYYHKNINRNVENALLESLAEDLKSKQSNDEETQNAICKALENNMKE